MLCIQAVEVFECSCESYICCEMLQPPGGDCTISYSTNGHSQGGGGTWERDQHSLFFFETPPPPTFLIIEIQSANATQASIATTPYALPCMYYFI